MLLPHLPLPPFQCAPTFLGGRGRRRRRRSAPALLVTSPLSLLLFLLLLATPPAIVRSRPTSADRRPRRGNRGTFRPSNHTSNRAVIVSTSRYWFNYRHVTNALSVYDLVKSNGIPDEDIILMLADDISCNPRNPYRDKIFPHRAEGGRGQTLFDSNVEVDYRGDDVTVDNFVRVLLGRHRPGELPSRRLRHDSGSNLLIYLTGHGGDKFFKFRDVEEIQSPDFRNLFRRMKMEGRYNEILFVADTCQAFTLADDVLDAPNVFSVGSSLKDENSYAHHSDDEVGLSVIDRYTHRLMEFLRQRGGDVRSIGAKEALVDAMSYQSMRAHVGYSDEGCERKLDEIALGDFVAARDGRGEAEVLEEACDFFAPNQTAGAEPAIQNEETERRRRGTAMKGATTPLTEGTGATTTSSKRTDDAAPTPEEEEEEAKWWEGTNPSDPRFLLALLGFVFAVATSSKYF